MRKLRIKKDRVAIIIGAPGEPQIQNGRKVYFEEPVARCVDLLTNYLKSPAGGSWSGSSEITYYHEDQFLDPETQRWYQSLSVDVYDYIYVHFVGHGGLRFVGEETEDIISLGGNSFPVRSLMLNNARQTVIVDACRSFPVESRGVALGDLITESVSYPYSMKRTFMQIVKQCPVGTVLIQSAGKGQSAKGDDYNGPFFTQSLILGSKQLVNKCGYVDSYQPIMDTLKTACAFMRENFNTNQLPVATTSFFDELEKSYPFVLLSPKQKDDFM